MNAPDLSPSDLALEERIQEASDRYAREVTREAWNALCHLVRQRSPAQVKRMEARMVIE